MQFPHTFLHIAAPPVPVFMVANILWNEFTLFKSIGFWSIQLHLLLVHGQYVMLVQTAPSSDHLAAGEVCLALHVTLQSLGSSRAGALLAQTTVLSLSSHGTSIERTPGSCTGA